MADREPGVYTTFETSMGRIICRLFEKQAPKTVENFIALAEGRREFLDGSTGGALLRNSRSRRTGPRSSSASVHALRSWHSKLRHPVQHSALDRGFDFLVLDRAGREAYPEYRLVP